MIWMIVCAVLAAAGLVRAFVWSRESGLAGGRLILAGGAEAPETAALAERLAAQYACVEYRPCAGCRE